MESLELKGGRLYRRLLEGERGDWSFTITITFTKGRGLEDGSECEGERFLVEGLGLRLREAVGYGLQGFLVEGVLRRRWEIGYGISGGREGERAEKMKMKIKRGCRLQATGC